MSGKIATEKELFTLVGGLEGDKPSNYDINRCVTKTRSEDFVISQPVFIEEYEDLQLVPISLFDKKDKIRIIINNKITDIPLDLDIVLLIDGNEEIHYLNTFHTYEWIYDNSFIYNTYSNNIFKQDKKYSIIEIGLEKLKDLMGQHNKAIIQVKARWSKKNPLNNELIYHIYLSKNNDETFISNNTINLLSISYLNVDVFFRKIFEIEYDSNNDSIKLLNNSEVDRSPSFIYNLNIYKNSSKIESQNIISAPNEFKLNLSTKDFKKGDILTLEIINFTIKLNTYDGENNNIIPDFTKTELKSIIKNDCKLSILKNENGNYKLQVEFLKDPKESWFNYDDLNIGDFGFGMDNNKKYAFCISLSKFGNSSYTYYGQNNFNEVPTNINLF